LPVVAARGAEETVETGTLGSFLDLSEERQNSFGLLRR